MTLGHERCQEISGSELRRSRRSASAADPREFARPPLCPVPRRAGSGPRPRSKRPIVRMKLYGTAASPFVRRVRVTAAEVGEPVELVNTATEAGHAELRALSPIWKVPVAIVEPAVAGGTLIY